MLQITRVSPEKEDPARRYSGLTAERVQRRTTDADIGELYRETKARTGEVIPELEPFLEAADRARHERVVSQLAGHLAVDLAKPGSHEETSESSEDLPIE